MRAMCSGTVAPTTAPTSLIPAVPVPANGRRGSLRRRAARRNRLQRDRPQRGGIGVEAEDELRLAREDVLGQAITERRGGELAVHGPDRDRRLGAQRLTALLRPLPA